MPHRFKGERTLMRIFIGESDKYHGKPLYQALLERLRAKGLARSWRRRSPSSRSCPTWTR